METKQLLTPNTNIQAKGGWCLAYIYDSLEISNSNRLNNARSEWAKAKKEGVARTDSAPKGLYVPIFLSIDPSVNDHIAWLLPDGRVYSTTRVGTYKPPILHKNMQEMIDIYASVGKKMVYQGYALKIGNKQVLEEVKKVEKKPTPKPAPVSSDGFLPPRGHIQRGDIGENIKALNAFMRKTFPLYSPAKILGTLYGPVSEASIKEFQRRVPACGKPDGKVGPLTYKALQSYGFKY